MTNEVLKIDTGREGIQGTVERFIETVEEVPWGNSDWQNRQAIVNMECTPERAYRHASLRIMNRLNALNECYFTLRKDEIQLERLRRKKAAAADDLDREEAQIEIDLILSRRPYQQKLVKDAVREVESLAPVIQSMGRLTRDQFEAAEAAHHQKKYLDAATGKSEALLGLAAMGVSIDRAGVVTVKDHLLFDRIVEAAKRLE